MHVAMCLGGSCPAAPSEISLLLFLFQLLLCVFIPPLIFPVIKFKGDSDQDGIENLQEKVGTITLISDNVLVLVMIQRYMIITLITDLFLLFFINVNILTLILSF